MVGHCQFAPLLAWLLVGAPQIAGGQPSAPSQEVRVTDYGVSPDNGRDATGAFLQALAQCGKVNRPVLVLPKGRYDFAETVKTGVPDQDPKAVLVIDDLSNLTIDGQGSTLVFRGDSSCFRMTRCAQIAVKNLTINWERPPFSQGRVLTVAPNQRSFDVQVDPGYPVRGDEPVPGIMEYDPVTKLPARNGLDLYDGVLSTALVAPQRLHVELRRPGSIRSGSLVVLRHRVYGHDALDLMRCSGVRLEDVTIYTCPGMAVRADRCEDITIQRLRVMIQPGSGRLLSATADGVHIKDCKGIAQITDSLFQGMGDDAVNAHGVYYTVRKRIDARTLGISSDRKIFPPPDFQPGDRLEFTASDTLIAYATGTVRACHTDKGANLSLVEFEENVPYRLVEGSDVVASVTWIPKLRMAHCTVRGNRARGCVIHTRDARVEDNEFQGTSSSGIHITCDETLFEAISTRQVVVRNNTFEGCNNGATRNPAVINVIALLRGGKRAPAGVHRDIVIEANVIRNTDNGAVLIGSVDGASVRYNRFEGANLRPTRNLDENAISVVEARNVEIIGNTYTSGSLQARMIFVGAGCDRQTIVARDNQWLGTRRTLGTSR
jgi:hypothetical protein